MTSITNLFSNFTDLTKTKSVTDNGYLYPKNKNESFLYTSTPALTQGDQFKNYQNKIKKNLERKANQLSGIEGFTGNRLKLDKMNLTADGLALQSNKIITSNDYSSQQGTLQNLRTQYETILKQYNALLAKYTGISNDYIKRVGSNNPYLGKNIRFTNGTVFYVTNQGVAKLYPSMDVYNSVNGLNGCPASGYIDINTVWNDKYNTPGSIIPTQPPLIVGTPMIARQSCGNEGKNVFVNTMVSNAQSKYVGCYNDQPPPTNINFAPLMNATNSVNGFTCSASSVYADDNNSVGAWRAFDKDPATYWHTQVDYIIGNTSTSYDGTTGLYIGTAQQQVLTKNNETITVKGEWLQMNCPSQYTLNSYSLLGRQDCCGQPSGRDPNTWYILGLNAGDGSWSEVDYQENQSFNWQKMTYTISNPKPYTSYLIIVPIVGDANAPAGSRNCLQIAEWEMLSAGATTDDSTTSAMIWNPNVIGYVQPEQCASYAAENGYKYYGLQGAKDDGTVACLVSQDIVRAQMYGEAVSSTPINLWASYTSDGVSATLTKFGSLSVYNSAGTAVYSSDNSTANPGNYIGCYNDCTGGRALPTALTVGANAGSTYQTCSSAAQQGNWKYFGLQFTQPSGTSECWVGNDLNAGMAMGVANNCITANGVPAGGTCSNAIYTTDETAGSVYILILQDDGNMCVYRGTSPSNMQSPAIWCSMTNGKQQQANPQFAASKGKYGQNWIASGSTLAPGDFVGSNDGSIYLMLQTDGNLVLNTFSSGLACPKNSSGTTVGADFINALYEIDAVGNASNIGKLAYIDENADLHSYPSDNKKYTSNYTEISRGMDTPGNDIPGAAYGNATLESCQTTCNNNPDCGGIVTNAAGNVCWPKTSAMYPNGGPLVANADRIIYLRNQTPQVSPIGVSDTTNNIDTIQYQQYVNGGNLDSEYGLAKLTSVQKQQLQDMRAQLDLLAQQINDYTNKFGNGSESAELQMGKNVIGLGKYLTDLKVTDQRITNFGTTMDNILNDSDIVVLQKNYDYLFWTILAAGTVLVAMNLVKK